jgi:hypothetical protein
VTAVDTCLLRIHYLAANVSLFGLRSLPSNGSTGYNIKSVVNCVLEKYKNTS